MPGDDAHLSPELLKRMNTEAELALHFELEEGAFLTDKPSSSDKKGEEAVEEDDEGEDEDEDEDKDEAEEEEEEDEGEANDPQSDAIEDQFMEAIFSDSWPETTIVAQAVRALRRVMSRRSATNRASCEEVLGKITTIWETNARCTAALRDGRGVQRICWFLNALGTRSAILVAGTELDEVKDQLKAYGGSMPDFDDIMCQLSDYILEPANASCSYDETINVAAVVLSIFRYTVLLRASKVKFAVKQGDQELLR